MGAFFIEIDLPEQDSSKSAFSLQSYNKYCDKRKASADFCHFFALCLDLPL
jgi:hypothetical protein